MKTCIFDGSLSDDKFFSRIVYLFRKHIESNNGIVDILDLKNMKIKPCLGCFGCWVKTPGECLIKDEGQEIPKKIVSSDLFIFITPLSFGGYSSEMKKALDRCIPILLPFFRNLNGEIHHKMRYDKYPNIIAFGINKDKDENTIKSFKELIQRNSINLGAKKHIVNIIQYGEDESLLERKISEVLEMI
mgnify:CR=1 FL=1